MDSSAYEDNYIVKECYAAMKLSLYTHTYTH